MTVDLKARFLREPLLKAAEIAASEVGHCAAVGADEVMMVLVRSSHQVAPAVAAGVNLTDEIQPGKYVERAVYGNESDAGVLLTQPFVYLGRRKMVAVDGDRPYHCAPLRSQLVAVLPQYGGQLLFRKHRFTCQLKTVFSCAFIA